MNFLLLLRVSLFVSLLLGVDKWRSYLRSISDGTVHSSCSSAPPDLFIASYRRRDLDAWVGPLILRRPLCSRPRDTRLARVHSGLATGPVEGCENHCIIQSLNLFALFHPDTPVRCVVRLPLLVAEEPRRSDFSTNLH
ncbi:hypothetical protein F4776DRAFT_16316 [Hypoxylon sp. NC0597]|nr:hypothetical protein F4776DRAFT_16316 [Hypoxylon sp. NC0597]